MIFTIINCLLKLNLNSASGCSNCQIRKLLLYFLVEACLLYTNGFPPHLPVSGNQLKHEY